jgi:hypothetical protein
MRRFSVKSRFFVAALLAIWPLTGHAASTSLSIVFNGPPSTAIDCPIAYPSGSAAFVEPSQAAMLVATCSVEPSSWSGVLALSGPDASFFALNGMDLIVGSQAITAPRTYNVTITATP